MKDLISALLVVPPEVSYPARFRVGERSSVPCTRHLVEHVVFTAGDGRFAIPAAAVQEMTRPDAVTASPHAPAWLAGVQKIRGSQVSIVSLQDFLHVRERGGERSVQSHLIVLRARHDERQVALLVTRVAGIRPISTDGLNLPVSLRRSPAVPFLRGVIAHEGRPLFLLDLERLLEAFDLQRFDS